MIRFAAARLLAAVVALAPDSAAAQVTAGADVARDRARWHLPLRQQRRQPPLTTTRSLTPET